MGCVESSFASTKPALILNGKVIEIIPKYYDSKASNNQQLRVSVAANCDHHQDAPSSTNIQLQPQISPYVSLKPYHEGDATQHFIVKHRDLKKIERESSSVAASPRGGQQIIAPTSLLSLQDKTDKMRREKIAFSPLLAPHRCLDSRGGSGMGLILFDSSSENPNQSYTLIEHHHNEDGSNKAGNSENFSSSFSIACYSSQEKKHYLWSVQEGNRLSLIPNPGVISDSEKFYFNGIASSPTLSPSTSSHALTSSLGSSLSSPPTSARGNGSQEEEEKNNSNSISSVKKVTALPHVLSEQFPSEILEETQKPSLLTSASSPQQKQDSEVVEIIEEDDHHQNNNKSHHHPPKQSNSSFHQTTGTTTTSCSFPSSNNSHYQNPSCQMVLQRTETHDETSFV